jgi:hypothetical protein
VYYLPVEMSREARQENLKKQFKFTCVCGLCSLGEEQSQQNDRRLTEIGDLDDLIAQDHKMSDLTLRTLRYVDRQVRLFEEQGPTGVGLARAYSDATRIVITNGDLARGHIFAGRAVAGWRTIHGSDSKSVRDYEIITRDPTKCDLYGKSMKWRTMVDEVPQGLEPSEFEDWLWRRKKPKLPRSQQLGQLADMWNHEIFPGFADLPNENDFDIDYHESSAHKPRRHWCFLGEIVEFICSLVCKWRLKTSMMTMLSCSSIPNAGVMSWHLRRFGRGTRSQFCMHINMHSRSASQVSATKIHN